jgi:hypothetical protein
MIKRRTGRNTRGTAKIARMHRAIDATLPTLCAWCAAPGPWTFPVTASDLTLYCCSIEHQQALQQALT